MSRKLWTVDVVVNKAEQAGAFNLDSNGIYKDAFRASVTRIIKRCIAANLYGSIVLSDEIFGELQSLVKKIDSLSEESNAFDQSAYQMWQTFHMNDGTEPASWFLMEEKSRGKWVELSKKVSFVKEGSAPTATGWVNQYTPSIKSKSNFDIDRTLLLSYMSMPVRPAIKSLPDRQLDRIRTMPPIVRAMVQEGNAWVVGSQAEFRPEHVKITAESDWDVIVPPAEWQDVMTRLHAAGALKTAEWSSVGGLRVTVPGKKGGAVKLDLWPAEISSHMMKPFTHVAWQPKTGAVWVRLDK